MRQVLVSLACITTLLLPACSTGAKKMTLLDLNPENLSTTLPQLCREMAKKPTTDALARILGTAADDPENAGMQLLITSAPAPYEQISVSVPAEASEIPAVKMAFKAGQGPSAAHLATILGPWREMPVEEHSLDLDQRLIVQKHGGYTCGIHAAVERPQAGAERGADHIRELYVSAAKF